MKVLQWMKKNQQLLWDLYAGITRDAKKNPTTIMETICGYCKECYKNPTVTMDWYASIATNEKCQ